jgi:dihydrolipoamide dehydrogenase
MAGTHYDVIVIGGGPGGYPAAIRAAQRGLTAACIDAYPVADRRQCFGGTCLNVGCIPSKALLESTELYHRAATEFTKHGIQIGQLGFDLGTMQARKGRIVEQLTSGIESLFKANGVTGLKGHGRLLPERKVEFRAASGEITVLSAEHVVLATGSRPIELPQANFDSVHIVDSTGALEFVTVPRRLGVIGAGVIGLELGSVWARLGAEVTMLEALDEFLPMADPQIAQESLRAFKRQALDIRLGSRLTQAERTGDFVNVTYESKDGTQTLEVDRLIVCVGRRPYTDNLLDANAGVQVSPKGHIEVDEHCRTGVTGVWAVGDVVRGPMLAHKATEEGLMVADLIAGRYGEVNYAAVPSIIYTAPEIAWVGQTETAVKASGRAYKTGSFSFAANGRAKAMEQAQGFVKFIAATDDDTLLGVHIMGPMAGELIAEAVLALEFSASAEDLQRTVHGHPTLSEALHEAALAVDKRALHAINR